MTFDEPIMDIVARRHSVRSYQPTPLSADALQAIMESGARSRPLFPQIGLRFIRIEDGPAFIKEHGGALRSYGRILGAPHYVAVVSEATPGYMVNAGFRTEQLILRATQVGVGTCWLGGAYRRQDVGQMLNVATDEQVVALTPLGYPAGGARDIASRAIKLLTPRQGKRHPLEKLVFAGEWGVPPGPILDDRPALRDMLEAARLAPSWVNSQPWRFVLREADLVIAVSRPAGQNELPYFLLDGGIAMSHISLVAAERGLAGAWTLDDAVLIQTQRACRVPDEHTILGTLPLSE